MAEDENAGNRFWGAPPPAPMWAGATTAGSPPPFPAPPAPARRGGFDETRPPPRLPGVLAAAGGLLVIASSSILISQLPKDNRRLTGLLLSIAFEALGLFALFLWRGRPAATAGVVVSAIAVVPALVFAFIDPNHPNIAFSNFGHGKGTLTGILAVAAALWLVAYFVGPGRRHAFYLGAALVAVWLVGLLQIATSSLEQFINRGETFSSGGSSGSSSFGTDGSISSPSTVATSTTTRIGVVSLVVGLAYLLFARLADRRGGTRAATPFLATVPVILTVAVLAMINPWKPEGASILAVALGVLLIVIGTLRGRRFTAWYGAFAVAAGTLALIAKRIDSNQTAAGLVTLAAGIAIAVLANWLTGRAEPASEAEPMTPLPEWSPPAPQT